MDCIDLTMQPFQFSEMYTYYRTLSKCAGCRGQEQAALEIQEWSVRLCSCAIFQLVTGRMVRKVFLLDDTDVEHLRVMP